MDIRLLINTIRITLIENFNSLDNWFDKSIELRTYMPSNGGWCIDQVLEHITLTNYFLLILIRKSTRKAKDNIHHLDLKAELENYVFNQTALDEIGMYKSCVWIRPEHMEPKEGKASDEVRRLLKMQMEECLEYLYQLSDGQGILYKTTMTVNNLGKINVYEYLYFLAKHGERHVEQMKRIENEYFVSK
jgi:hypothetical protein